MLIPLVVAAALMNAAMVAASAVSTILVADDLSAGLAGLPNTAGVLGTAAGAVAVGRWSARHGRAQALRTGYGISVAGAALTVLAAVGAPVLLLFAGMFLLGAGNAASLLSRYAAADAAAPARRAAAMGTVVWASTAGAVGGPFLLEPAQAAATSAGLPALSGPFLLAVAAAFSALLAASRIRPQPAAAAVDAAPDLPAPRTPLVPVGVMLVGHLVMVAMTTSVPVHAHHQGQSLGALGLMLSFHTLGMFALSPVTGWWIDRAGPRPVMLTGLVTVMVSATAMTLHGPTFTVVLFLLGYGWNLCYLGGSASLRRSAGSPAAATRLESRAEAWVWAVAALATAASTGVFAEGGFRLLSTGSVVIALPLLVVVARRRTVRTTAPDPERARG
ncbi:MFS transporter [Kribbella sp. DT2]|uniref:MFS transporter n=1 Tax=Kribbella sp. DT2 TaxID=3393427 RepID=UPI003CFB8B3B